VTDYEVLKTIHIVSSTVLFGTGLGTAFFKWTVDRSGDVAAIRVVSERVVLADWLFTTPAIVTQAVTGIALARLLGYPLTTTWIAWAIGLYCVAGLCWIPVVLLQLRMRNLAREAHRGRTSLPPEYRSCARAWFWLGVPAFAAVLIVLGLMVVKPQA
jgi:uncharacterized membrane protein